MAVWMVQETSTGVVNKESGKLSIDCIDEIFVLDHFNINIISNIGFVISTSEPSPAHTDNPTPAPTFLFCEN